MTGVFASPNMIVYVGTAGTASVAVTGLVYGNAKQLRLQALALGFIIVYDAVATFIVIKLVGLIVPLRMTDKELEVGDLAPPRRGGDRHGPPDEVGVAVNGHLARRRWRSARRSEARLARTDLAAAVRPRRPSSTCKAVSGLTKVAVPTWTARAPTVRKSRADAASMMPPTPMTGMCTASHTAATAASASG